MLIVSPYHLDEPLAPFDYSGPRDATISVELRDDTDRWSGMERIYQRVADTVAASADPPIVIAGDCTTSLGVLAGLQRSTSDVGIVWFDAHGDFHTEQTTTSGYLGGLPLAIAAGVGMPRMTDIGLAAVPGDRILLVGARDLDPPEYALLDQAGVRRVDTSALTEQHLPAGTLYLHVDVDVCHPGEFHDLLYPSADGPPLPTVNSALRQVVSTGRVGASSLAATFRHGGRSALANDMALRALVATIAA